MRPHRAPIVLAGTAAGLALTLAFQPHTPRASRPATTVAATSSSATAARSVTASASASRTATSAVFSNQYGNVQLKVTVAGGKITAIEPVQLPSQDGKSVQINAYAEPLLRASALKAQSAQIDAVSGATYTSTGYQQALQSALDRVDFKATGAVAS